MNYRCIVRYLFVGFVFIASGCASVQLPKPIVVAPYSVDKYVYLPDYDINNIPISIWVIRDGADNVGLLIAGHAEKAICQLASVEVITKFEELGANKDKLISFGIGFDIRPKSSVSWSSSYDEKISVLVNNLKELARKYPQQVKIYDIQYSKYQQALSLLNEHIQNINKSTWDTHIVEYKYFDSPLIIPFQYLDSGKILTFRVAKSKFGQIPYGLALSALTKKIDDATQEINQIIEHNKTESRKLDITTTDAQVFRIWKAEGNDFILKNITLPEEPKPLAQYILQKTVNGVVVETRSITPEEARQHLKRGVSTPPEVKAYLENWIERVDTHRRTIKNKKFEIKKDIDYSNNILLSELDKFSEYKKKIQNLSQEDSLLIDAFLRGWPFSTSNEYLNAKLDSWYNQNRADVWNMILSDIPNSRTNSQLGGIFHSDDVFFKVISNGDEYEITPYKVIGGEFIQVLDKQVGITQYFTPFNFREQNGGKQ